MKKDSPPVGNRHADRRTFGSGITSNYPFSRILLATEHTEFDAGAERLAFATAKRCGVPLLVVFPMIDNPEAEMPESMPRDEPEVAGKIAALQEMADADGIQLDVRVRHRPEIHAGIVAAAHESRADLIVIRRRGKHSLLASLSVGEMVSRVIRDASCSVLLVPRAAAFWNRRVLAAMSDTAVAPIIARTAGAIAGMCGLPLTVLSVAPDEAALPAAQKLNTLNVALASALSDQVRGEVRVGQPVEQTIAAVKESAADLVVIGRQRYHLMPFGHHGIMQQIAGSLDVPTLVLHT